MQVRLAMLAAIALAAVGCSGGGGGGGAGGDASSVVPQDAIAYVTVDTDAGSTQLKSASAILDKFPIRAKLLTQIESSAARSGTNLRAVFSSAGPELDIAVLNVDGAHVPVGFAKPSDEKTFLAQLAKGSSSPPVHESIDGWTVFADKQAALDAVANRNGSLSDDAAFQAAMKTLPGDALVRAYTTPAGAQAALGQASGTLGAAGQSLSSVATSRWIAAAVSAQDSAFKLEVHAKGRTPPTASSVSSGAGIADEIPAGAIVALSVAHGIGGLPANAKQQAAALSSQVGFDVGAIAGALGGPVVAYLRPAVPLPEVTLAAKPAHPQQAAQAVGKLIARLAKGAGRPTRTQLDGAPFEKLDLGSVGIYYGSADGKLVVTDSANALSELKGSSGHLSDDDVFKEAKAGAGLPDDAQGFLYVNLKDAVPALQGFAQLAHQTLPQGVLANLRPLRSLLVYGSRDGDVQSFVAYVKTS